jgi:hypothetical protein
VAAFYAEMEARCRQAARRIRSGAVPDVVACDLGSAPFHPLHPVVAPELRTAQDTSNPFARMILAGRALSLRLWFFNRSIVPVVPTALPADARQRLADVLDHCAAQFNTLLQGALERQQVPPSRALAALRAAPPSSRDPHSGSEDALLKQGIHRSILQRAVQDLQTVTACHNALLARWRAGRRREPLASRPAATGSRLVDAQSMRAGVKLVLLTVLLLAAEGGLGWPGGTQVAFFATFFAGTGNLGRQNKTDLVGMVGLLGAFAYGIAAAFITSRLPQFPLMLVLVFLGMLLAALTYQRLPRYKPAGFQAALGLPFVYLATTGPGWSSFPTGQTRFWGLAVVGFLSVVVHAYVWPVLPMRRLRASIGAALRDTAASVARLFDRAPRSAWEGAPPSLGETITRADDLLDDARYLPGPEHADLAYFSILGCLQEIDANLEYVRYLLSLEPEHALREHFYQVVGDYAAQAQSNLERVARQFLQPPSRAARIEPVRWEPDTSGRWERSDHLAEPGIDAARSALIARCLDQIAQATGRISGMAREINLRNCGR